MAAAAAGNGGWRNGTSAAPSPSQRVFEILPLGAPGLTEYTLVIDGQTLRYRNAAAQWVRLVSGRTRARAGRCASGDHARRSQIEIQRSWGFRTREDVRRGQARGAREEPRVFLGRGDSAVAVHLKFDQPARRCAGRRPVPMHPRPRAGRHAATAAGLRGICLPALVVGADATAVASLPAASGVAAMIRPVTVPLAYFGKLPSRGDFVRSPSQAGLIQTLDRWLARAWN